MSIEQDIATVKKSIESILALELQLIRDGVATSTVRRGLNEAVVDLGVHLVKHDPSNVIWFLQKGDQHGKDINKAVEDGMASLTAEQAADFAKFVAENPQGL